MEPGFYSVTPCGVEARLIGLVHLLRGDIRAGFDPLENDVALPFVEPGTRVLVADRRGALASSESSEAFLKWLPLSRFEQERRAVASEDFAKVSGHEGGALAGEHAAVCVAAQVMICRQGAADPLSEHVTECVAPAS